MAEMRSMGDSCELELGSNSARWSRSSGGGN